VLVLALRDDLAEAYEGYPTWLLVTFGWLLVVVLPVIGFLLARMPWRAGTHLDGAPPDEDATAPPYPTGPQAERTTTTYDGGQS
jgi:NSS family neurotransmitter:Na+ symporter